MDDVYPQSFFENNLRFLKLAGMWMPDSSEKTSSRYFWTCYSVFGLVSIDVWYHFSEYMKLADTYEDLQTLIEHIGILCAHSMVLLKVSFWFLNKQKILNIMRTLEDARFKYESFEDFRPARETNKAKKLTDGILFSFFVIGGSILLVTLIPIYVELIYRYSEADFDNGDVTCDDLLPYYCWIPFDINTHRRCGFALVYQTIGIFFISWQVGASDTIFTNTMHYIKAHFLILQGLFRTIRGRCLKDLNIADDDKIFHDADVPKLDEMMQSEMKKATIHLQVMIKLCEDMESAFAMVTLAQTLISLFSIVTCLYMITTVSVLSPIFAVEVTYLPGLYFQLAQYCWAGDEITQASDGLTNAMYECDWFAASKSFKKSLLINMLRMKIPVYLTIGKFTPLTLTTLLTIFRGSYSFCTFLKTQDG